jgi:hypothetical protein
MKLRELIIDSLEMSGGTFFALETDVFNDFIELVPSADVFSDRARDQETSFDCLDRAVEKWCSENCVEAAHDTENGVWNFFMANDATIPLWRKIDTAPLNGDDVIAYEPSTRTISIARFGLFSEPGNEGDSAEYVWNDGRRTLHPTHWKPCPDTPEKEVQRGDVQTPESTLAWAAWGYGGPGVSVFFARNLEFERDEALDKIHQLTLELNQKKYNESKKSQGSDT